LEKEFFLKKKIVFLILLGLAALNKSAPQEYPILRAREKEKLGKIVFPKEK